MRIVDKPRERMIKTGASQMSDSDLLTILLSPGTKSAPCDILARALLKQFGSIQNIASRRPQELTIIPGIGMAKACRLLAALETGRRAIFSITDPIYIRKPADVFTKMSILATEPEETFVAIGLNVRNRVTGEWVIAKGWESGINLNNRQIYSLLLKEGVARVIFVHNHPSGDPTPSDDDIMFTGKLLEAGRCLDITVIDHVIIGAQGHASIREIASDTLNFG